MTMEAIVSSRLKKSENKESEPPPNLSSQPLRSHLRRIRSPFYRRQQLEAPDGYARMTGTCGDTMEIFLKIRDERVAECAFRTDGCGTTIVCGSVATELASGNTIIESLGAVSGEGILRVLGGLPESSAHCAQLASETLRRALADYLSKKNALWKKHYPKK